MAEADSSRKRCCTCLRDLPVSDFGPAKQRRDGLRPRCRECHRRANAESRAKHIEASREATRNWQRNNPEKAREKRLRWEAANPGRMRELQARWREKNPVRVQEKLREYRKIPSVRVMRTIGSRVRLLLSGKRSKLTEHLVGYTGDYLVAHLERQFLEGMSWDNYGDWHIDHIGPLSSFSVTSLDDPVIGIAWGLPNLRPIWANENIRKRDKRLFLI